MSHHEAMRGRHEREGNAEAIYWSLYQWRRQYVDDQNSQFGSHDWRDFVVVYKPRPSMRRRGNCHGIAVVDSFFQLFKRERIRRRVCASREQAWAIIFNDIEMFYNPKERYSHAGAMSPVEFEIRHFENYARLVNPGRFGRIERRFVM